MLAVYLSPVYIIGNGYLLFRILRWLGVCSGAFRKKRMYLGFSLVYILLASSVLLAFFLPAGEIRRSWKLIANYWLGFLLYLSLVVLAADLIRFVHFLLVKGKKRRRGHTPRPRQGNAGTWSWGTPRFRAAAGGICGMVILMLCAWGIYNARVIHVTPYEITVEKDGGTREDLDLVLISDLHLGYNIGISRMIDMVEKINEQNVDLVVIAGDIFDNEYEALEQPEKLASVLAGIQSKYGVYACYGNHDIEEPILAGFTFGGRKKKESSVQMDTFLEKAGIHLLRDEAVLIDDSFYLYGRPDARRPGRGIDVRRTASELMEGLDSRKPVLVLDHEPKEFQELADAGVDVDLCGHTHDGQMFPANLITALMWENSYGYLKKDDMHTIVTSGVGLFGPNMRVGTIAEICRVRIHFCG